MPIISVIVPVYNVEEYLDRCIESIIAQTFTDFELILIDDGSPDNCPKMCDEWAKKDNRIVVIHQENGGLSAARNAGIDWAFSNSNSEWLTFIDSDDWVHPQMFEVLYNSAASNDVSISVCDYYTSDKPTPSIDLQILNISRFSVENAYKKRGGLLDLAVGKLYKKELFKTIRYPHGLLYEDAWTTYRVIFSVNEIVLISEAFYCYYVNPQSITNSKWSPAWMTEIEAHEAQLRFFNDNKLHIALQEGIRAYLWVIQKQIYAMRKSQSDTKQFEKIALKKMRKTLKVCKKQFSDKNYYRNLWEFCHPIASTCIGILNSLKRRINIK